MMVHVRLSFRHFAVDGAVCVLRVSYYLTSSTPLRVNNLTKYVFCAADKDIFWNAHTAFSRFIRPVYNITIPIIFRTSQQHCCHPPFAPMEFCIPEYVARTDHRPYISLWIYRILVELLVGRVGHLSHRGIRAKNKWARRLKTNETKHTYEGRDTNDSLAFYVYVFVTVLLWGYELWRMCNRFWGSFGDRNNRYIVEQAVKGCGQDRLVFFLSFVFFPFVCVVWWNLPQVRVAEGRFV